MYAAQTRGGGISEQDELALRQQAADQAAQDRIVAQPPKQKLAPGEYSLGMLNRTGARYGNTPETALFLDRTKPPYVGGILEMCNPRPYPFWGALTEGLRTGKPQNEVKHGGDFFGTLYGDPERLAGFLNAMTGISIGSGQVIAKKFPWKKYKTFVDVGCAQGGMAVEIALAHKHLRGGGMDLTAVRPMFEAYAGARKVASRLQFHPGDFFKDALPNADVVNLKSKGF